MIKKSPLIITIWVLILLLQFETKAQELLPDSWNDYIFTFEDTTFWHSLTIDTIDNPDNVWQIGQPQKSIINYAYTPPNVIITDTLNGYPSNNISTFVIYHEAQGGFIEGGVAVLSGFFKVDSDSISDYGIIDISPDNGITWINLLTDTLYTDYYNWITNKPVLTGRTLDWQFFAVQLAGIRDAFQLDSTSIIKYRFSFLSDGIDNARDGLAYDNLHFQDYLLGVNENQKNYSVDVYPNPCKDYLWITINSIKQQNKLINFEIIDMSGKNFKISKSPYFNDNRILLNKLKPGNYILIIKNSDRIIYKQKIIKL